MSFKIVREHFACMGHRIPGHDGKCKNLHGHNYKFIFEFEGQKLDNNGILVDFGDIKNSICKWIDDNWDHKTLLWNEDPLLPLLQKEGKKYGVFVTEFCPTAEEMAKFLVEVVGPEVFRFDGNCFLVKCTVQETDKCSASYRRAI